MTTSLRLTGRGTAEVYMFRPVHADGTPDFGWAICTVNDASGELLITSDRGNFAHRWNVAALGKPSLTHFIGDFATYKDRGRFDYLASKLLGGRDGAREFCPKRTTAALQQRILERRREDGHRPPNDLGGFVSRRARILSRWIARDLWDTLDELATDLAPSRGAQAQALYWERLPDEMHNFFSDFYDDARTVPTAEYENLCNFILPAIAAACLETARACDAAPVAPVSRRHLKVCTCDNTLGSSVSCRGAAALGELWCCALTGEPGRAAPACGGAITPNDDRRTA